MPSFSSPSPVQHVSFHANCASERPDNAPICLRNSWTWLFKSASVKSNCETTLLVSSASAMFAKALEVGGLVGNGAGLAQTSVETSTSILGGGETEDRPEEKKEEGDEGIRKGCRTRCSLASWSRSWASYSSSVSDGWCLQGSEVMAHRAHHGGLAGASRPSGAHAGRVSPSAKKYNVLPAKAN